jgi:putative membrane protein
MSEKSQGGSAPWPGWVYAEGSDPDYRFSFANERTFLAWIRTALALVAGGVALDVLEASGGGVLPVLPAALLALGGLCAIAAWTRWARAERALRRGASLPPSYLTLLLAVCVLLVAVAAIVL